MCNNMTTYRRHADLKSIAAPEAEAVKPPPNPPGLLEQYNHPAMTIAAAAAIS